MSALRALQLICFCAGSLLGISICLAAESGTAKRVLIIHSFGRDFAPYDAMTATFRRELASRAQVPIIFLEAALDAGRTIDAAEEAAFVTYLRARFAHPQAPDLIVTIGPPAGQFALRHRDGLFASMPVILTALDARLVPSSRLKPGDALIATSLDLPRFFETIVRALPETTTMAVIAGDSTLERFWQRELQRESAVLADRVNFVWLYGLSLQQIKEKVAALPPHAVIVYAVFIVDAAGIPHERLDALAEIRVVSRLPDLLPLRERDRQRRRRRALYRPVPRWSGGGTGSLAQPVGGRLRCARADDHHAGNGTTHVRLARAAALEDRRGAPAAGKRESASGPRRCGSEHRAEIVAALTVIVAAGAADRRAALAARPKAPRRARGAQPRRAAHHRARGRAAPAGARVARRRHAATGRARDPGREAGRRRPARRAGRRRTRSATVSSN